MDFGKLAYIKAQEFESAKESGGVGYTEGGTVVFPQTTLTFEGGEAVPEQVFSLTKGKQYTLRLQKSGASDYYTATATTVGAEEDGIEWGTDTVWNIPVTDAEGNVLIYITVLATCIYPEYQTDGFACAFGLTNTAYLPADVTVTVTITITEAETIHPIDPKFLPEQVVGEEVWGMTLAQGVGQALADGSGLAMVSVTDDAEKATTITEQCTSADKIRFMTGQTTTYEVPFSFKNYENGVLQTAGCSAMLWLNDALYLAHVLLMFGGSAVGAFIVVRPALA